MERDVLALYNRAGVFKKKKKTNRKCCDICVGASDQCLGRFGTAVHVEMGLGVLVWQGPLEPSTCQAATFL